MNHTIFTINDNPSDIKQFYDEQGFVIIRQKEPELLVDELTKQITELLKIKYKSLNMDIDFDSETVLSKGIMKLFHLDRSFVSHVYDAINTLPALQSLNNHHFINKCLSLMDRTPYNLMDVARLRLDFPNESKYMTTEHQESFYHDVPDSSINMWIPITDVDSNMGPLLIRPKSQQLGRLPTIRKEICPYFFLEDGAWKKQYPQQTVLCNKGDIILFHNSLIHTGSLNTGTRPRVSVQVRFNWLNDPQYLDQGWPRSYQIKERYDKKIDYKY